MESSTQSPLKRPLDDMNAVDDGSTHKRTRNTLAAIDELVSSLVSEARRPTESDDVETELQVLNVGIKEATSEKNTLEANRDNLEQELKRKQDEVDRVQVALDQTLSRRDAAEQQRAAFLHRRRGLYSRIENENQRLDNILSGLKLLLQNQGSIACFSELRA